MRLVPLFEGELRFDERNEVGLAAYGETGIVAYAPGDGHIAGDRLKGSLRWTNNVQRRADGVGLPNFHGVIRTDDGADILFAFNGYNLGVRMAEKPHPLQPYERRAVLAALTLAAADPRYQWVNRLFAVMEGDVRPFADPEHWRVRAFECINEISDEAKSRPLS